MRRFTVAISEQAFDVLRDRSFEERRSIRDQAAVYLERMLTKTIDVQPDRSGQPCRQDEPAPAA